MTQPNPFQAPTAELVAERPGAASLRELARGQKLLIFAILINIAAIVLRSALSTLLAAVLGLVTLVLAIMGILGMAAALRFTSAVKVLLALSMLIPFVNLVVMLFLNVRATKVLKARGYKVGLLGASKP
jgi:hypothetical protein